MANLESKKNPSKSNPNHGSPANRYGVNDYHSLLAPRLDDSTSSSFINAMSSKNTDPQSGV